MSPVGPDIAGLDADFARAVIVPWMAYPEDELQRAQVLAVGLGELAALADEPLSPSLLPALVLAAQTGTYARFVDDAHRGFMAGMALLALLSHRAAGVDGAGLDRAFHAVSTELQAKACTNARGERFRASRDTVRTAWRDYCSVAHFWAAHLLLTWKADPRDGLKLGGLAEGLRRLAHSAAAGSCGVHVSGVEPFLVKAPANLAPGLAEALRTFVPRSRLNGGG